MDERSAPTDADREAHAGLTSTTFSERPGADNVQMPAINDVHQRCHGAVNDGQMPTVDGTRRPAVDNVFCKACRQR